jgi:hypothetical protein
VAPVLSEFGYAVSILFGLRNVIQQLDKNEKVKFTLEQAMKDQREGRVIALLFL